MNNRLFFFFIYFLFHSLFNTCYATTSQAAPCTYSVTNGWTQTITYQCSAAVNLNGASIVFTVDNPAGLTNLASVWGFINIPTYPLSPALSLSGNTVTLPLNFSNNPTTLAAGVTTYFSYSTNNNVNVRSFALYLAGSTTTSGALNFAQASGSDTLPNNTSILISGVNTPFSTTIDYATQQSISNVPFGSYQVSATGTVNNQSVAISVSPSQLTLSATNATIPVTLSYTSTIASLTVILPTQQPSDVNLTSIPINITSSAGTSYSLSVPWGSQAILNGLTSGLTYSLAATTINGQKNQYSFSFTPTSIVLNPGTNSAVIGVSSKSLPTGTANVIVSGLPASIPTSLMFSYSLNGSTQTLTMSNVSNGLHSYTLPGGLTYSLTTQPVFANGNRYTSSPITLNIKTGTTTSVNLPFTAKAVTGVGGWPNYIAMGAVTDDAPGTATSLESRPIDAIFKYGGLGGNGDPGQIIYPIFDMETAEQAKTLTNFYSLNGISNSVRPVMVIYTADMSGGTSFTDFEYTNLVMHYINLIMETQKLQSYNEGSIILNPDLFGTIQQENILGQLNTAISTVSLQLALKTAVCFATSTINTIYGNNLNYEQLYEAILATTDPWSAMSIWNDFQMQYFVNCTVNPKVPSTISIPTFTNDFPGWVQSTNWIIRQFGPDVTFGWQENLWGIGSANWVHANYTSSNLQTEIANPTAATIVSTSAYSGNYIPDFLVFDKYEMDAIPGATAIGYLYNSRDWTNVLAYVKSISETLGTIPVMLWQIPGGHLQQVGDIDTRNSNGSTEPDFFFGDTYNPLTNLKPYITAIQLPSSIYGTTNISTYLSMDELGNTGDYTWSLSNLSQAADSHVFAILWGGGNTTSVGSFPSDDGGWLANKIINYYKNPTPISFAKYKHNS